MDSFFIADKLRGIPLVSGGKQQQQQQTNRENEQINDTNKHPAGLQLEKRHVASSASSNNNAILFKSAGITASTSNLRKETTSSKPTTAAKWPPTTTTTRRPPTTTTSTRRKQATATATATTRKPSTRHPVDQNSRQVAQAPNTTTTAANTTTSSTISVSSSSVASARSKDQETRTTLRKFDKLIQYQAEASNSNSNNDNVDDERKETNLAPASATTAQLPQVTQPFNQRRTAQPILGPQRFNEGRSAGENWIVFNRPDGGYSFFEVLVLTSSLIMVSTIVLVIIGSWVRSFKRKRQKRMMDDRESATQATDSCGGGGGGGRTRPHEEPTTANGSGSAPTTTMLNLQSENGEAGDATRKISTISSGLTSLGTTTTLSELTSGSSSNQTKPPEATIISMPTATTTMNEIRRPPVESSAVQQQVVSAAQNISSEIKQAAGNLSAKAMAIVQPTENNTTTTPTSSSSSAAAAAARAAGPSIDSPADKMSGDKPTDAEQSMVGSKSASDLSPAGQKTKKATDSADQVPHGREGKTGQLEDLFSSTARPTVAPGTNQADELPPTTKRQPEEKKAAVSRVGSLDSIELPPTLVESIKRSDGSKTIRPDEAPSPNLLLGQREPPAAAAAAAAGPAAVVEAIAGAAPALGAEQSAGREKELAGKKETKEPNSAMQPTNLGSDKKQQQKLQASGEKKALNGDKADDQSRRPGNPMGRDEKPPKETTKQPNTKTASAAAATTATATTTTTTRSTAEVKNHQVVVNKLDKRKTNLEIVDLRDDSVTGKMRSKEAEARSESAASGNWISMDGVAVIQPAASGQSAMSQQQQQPDQQQPDQQVALISPSELIESRFHVDYKGKRRGQLAGGSGSGAEKAGSKDSNDSKATDYLTNNIESELEQDNKMRNRKYFVYIVHDGHFTAKKECIARLELPPKRRVTLAEMRQLIANSQDISLTSLRRNRFKFVTETYRLLNENEDATILHQVYPTQGVFLKLNIPDQQESQAYAFKGARAGASAAGRLSTGSGGFAGGGPGGNGPAGSSLSNTTIASRRRAGMKQQDDGLPAIELDGYALGGSGGAAQNRASSVSRRNRQPAPGGSYRRSKSSVVQGRGSRQQRQQQMTTSQEQLPSIDGLMRLMPDNGDYDNLDDNNSVDRRRPFIGQPIADMSDSKMRIQPRWKNN